MKRKVIAVVLGVVMSVSMLATGVKAAPASAGSVQTSKTDGVTNTTYGKVRGFKDGGTYTFRGIPYAKAERFGMPEAPDSWSDIKNCLVYGPTAPITKMTAPDGGDFLIPHRYWAQNENCQNLNIWTQSLDKNAKKPVMVWFHGGGYTNGSAIEGVAYDGKNLSEYGDVVVVTVNHRLNVLGYLDLSQYGEKYRYSGNAGIADLVASLEWVQKNIENFGGDPNNVTIFGQSGGGGKVLSMMSTPKAEGLFDRAIVQSGGASFQNKEVAEKVAAELLNILNLSGNQVDELKNVPYDVLDAAGNAALAKVGKEMGSNVAWRPVIDEDYLHSSFLEWSNNVPVMVGSVFGEQNCWNDLDANVVNKNNWTQAEVMSKLRDKYGDKAEEILAAFNEAWPEKNDCDAYYVASRQSQLTTLNARAAAGAGATYNYLVSFESPLDGGICLWHCGEIPMVFHNVDLVKGAYGGSADAYALEDVMCSAWVNFAYNGNPNGNGVPAWSTYTAGNESTMIFDTVSGERVSFDKKLQELLK